MNNLLVITSPLRFIKSTVNTNILFYLLMTSPAFAENYQIIDTYGLSTDSLLFAENGVDENNDSTIMESDATTIVHQSKEWDKGFRAYNSFKENTGWTDKLWGHPAHDHLYLGMWTHHFQPDDDQQSNNKLISLTYRGYYAGTFRNTFDDCVWSAGWQRLLYQDHYGVFNVEAGYRLGMMYGYKKYLRLFDTPFFPLFQTVLDIDYKSFGIQLSWAGVVAAIGFGYKF